MLISTSFTQLLQNMSGIVPPVVEQPHQLFTVLLLLLPSLAGAG